MGGYGRRGLAVGGMALVAVLSVVSCTAKSGNGDARALQEARRSLGEAGSFRMVGEFGTPDGTTTRFDARLDGHGGCKGTVGRAESLLVGRTVWTRWGDSALPDAVAALNGGPLAAVDPAASADRDPAWAATELLRGAYMVTRLPGKAERAEGIAPVCQAGQLVAQAGDDGADVTSSAVVERGGERLRPLTLTDGPVTIRVYVPEKGKPTVRRAEYRVEGGRSYSIQFSELGKPVAVRRPSTSDQTVNSEQVLAALQQNGS
jgi:hypothetical protein